MNNTLSQQYNNSPITIHLIPIIGTDAVCRGRGNVCGGYYEYF